MNLNQLRFVLAVAKSKSFSRAAEQCHVTQPTLSNGIAQLEDEFAGKLFHRTTRSVNLTPFGEHLLPKITAVMNELDELKTAAKHYQEPEQKLLRIGLSPVIDFRLLSEILAPFKQANPEVEIFFKECFLDDMQSRLLNAQIDLAFLPKLEHRVGWQYAFFYQEDLYYVPHDGSPLGAAKTPIDLKSISQQPLIFTVDGCGLAAVTRGHIKRAGINVQEYPGQAMAYNVLEDWADLGVGAGILPFSKLTYTRDRARLLTDESGQVLQIVNEMVCTPQSEANPLVQELMQHIQRVTPTIVKGRAA